MGTVLHRGRRATGIAASPIFAAGLLACTDPDTGLPVRGGDRDD